MSTTPGIPADIKRLYARGRDFAEQTINRLGYKDAKSSLEKAIESSKDFGDYNDFDRGAESVLREHGVAP